MQWESVFNSLEEKIKANMDENETDYVGSDGLLYCGKCNTPKQVEVVLFDEIRRPFCLCKCEKEKIDRQEEEKKRHEFEKKVMRLRQKGFPEPSMQDWTFANDDMENERITKAMKRYVENFEELRKQGKGLLLIGDVGTGKTYAACEVANALIDEGYSVLVTNFARILNTLQGTFEKQQYIDELSDYSLLVIDDLGAERNTEYSAEQVFNVIDARYRSGKPMIITSNLSLEKIKNPPDTESKRIYDRIIERCFPIEITGKSRRRKNVREGYADMKALLGL